MSSSRDPSPSTTQSVIAALDLLEDVAKLGSAGISEVSRQTGMTLNRTYRLLTTLEVAGYLSRDKSKAFQLGPKLMLLGRLARQGDPLVQAAAPAMDWLLEQTGETISLTVRVGLEHITVDVRESRFPLKHSISRRTRSPLYWGARGFCLLAFAPLDVQQAVFASPLQPLSEQTVTGPQALEAKLEEVRNERVFATREDTLGIFSIAAPVLGTDDKAVGALAISGALTRLDMQAELRYRNLVRKAAARVASHLLL